MPQASDERLLGGPQGSGCGVGHEYGSRHGADTTGHRGYGAGYGLHRLEVHIANKFPIVITVHTNIYDDGTWLDEVGGYHLRPAACGNEDISLLAYLGKIRGLGMAYGNSRISLKEHERHGLAHDSGASNHNSVFPAMGMPYSLSSRIIPLGVHDSKPGVPRTSEPRLRG